MFFLLIMVINSLITGRLSLSNVLIPSIFLVYFFGFIYFRARSTYRSNKKLSETIEYGFSNDGFDIKGETFSSQSSWNTVYEVSQTKNWIFVWQSQQVANVIPRQSMWEGDVAELRDILNINKVKNNFK